MPFPLISDSVLNFRDSYDYEEGSARFRENRKDSIRLSHKSFVDEISRVTSLLCEACGLIKKNGMNLTPELWDWYSVHQRKDKERISRERNGLEEV